MCHVRPGEQGIEVRLGLGRVGTSGDSRDQLVDDLLEALRIEPRPCAGDRLAIIDQVGQIRNRDERLGRQGLVLGLKLLEIGIELSQVLLGLKSRSLDLYSVPAGFPAGIGRPYPPFRSDRPPDAGSVPFGPVREQPTITGALLETRGVSLGVFFSIGRLFTAGLFPPTRSSFLTKAGSSNPIVPELRASYQSCLQ